MVRITRFSTRASRRTISQSSRFTPQPAISVRSAIEGLESRTLFAAGDLDPSWGVAGQAVIDLPNLPTEGFTVIDVANGRTVVGGISETREGSTAPREAMLAVLDSNGQLVKSFSNDGIETKALQVPGGVIDLVVQPDNKIVIIGGTVRNEVQSAVLARFNTNGLLDTTFGGGDGQIPLPFGARTVALAPGGKIVVAGRTSDGLMGVARFTASGAADGEARATFDFVEPSGIGNVEDVIVQPDGRALVVGSAHVNDSDEELGNPWIDALVVRFDADLTSPDATFGGGDGVVRFSGGDTTEYGDFAEAITLDGQGRIVTASWLASTGPIVHRLLGDGSIDPTFAVTDFGRNARPDEVNVAPDGKIVVSGHNFFGGQLLLRINPDGGLDTTFGGGDGYIQGWDDGAVVGGLSDIQPDGKIISASDHYDEFTVFRHLAEGDDDTGTVERFHAIAAYVRDGSHANTNFGSSTQLQVKQGATGWNRHSYLEFNLPTAGTNVTSAVLHLFGRLDNTQAPSASFSVYNAAPTDLFENQLTWNNKPAAGTVVRATKTVTGTSGAWYEVDLTSFVQAEMAAGRDEVLLVLKATAASPSTIVFDSDEAANVPQLVVTSEGGPPPPQQELVVSSTNVSVPEGGDAAFTVKLAHQPTEDVDVFIEKAAGGDADLTTTTDRVLTFTPDNWDVAQSVGVAAAEDADQTNGAATFTLSSRDVSPKAVATTEVDNDVAAEPVTLRAAADAYVRDGSTYSNTNFGNATALQVKQGAAGWNRHSYLRFDLSSVDAVNSATLRLFGRLDNTQAASAGFTVFDAAGATWSETGLTWNNKPAAGTSVRGSGTVTGTAGKWYELDLTAFLQAEKDAGRSVVTLVIKATAASPSNILFDSDEAANRPELVVS